MKPNIIVTDRDEGVNARIRISCTTKEKGSDNEACVTFNVVTEEVRLEIRSKSIYNPTVVNKNKLRKKTQ